MVGGSIRFINGTALACTAGKSCVIVSVGQPKLIKIIEIRSTSYYRDDVAFVFHLIDKTFLLDCTVLLFHHDREYYLSAFLYIKPIIDGHILYYIL